MTSHRHSGLTGSSTRYARRRVLAMSGLGIAASAIRGSSASTQATPSPVSDDWSWLDRAVDDGMKLFGIVGTAVAVANSAGVHRSITAGMRDQTTQQPVTT